MKRDDKNFFQTMKLKKAICLATLDLNKKLSAIIFITKILLKKQKQFCVL